MGCSSCPGQNKNGAQPANVARATPQTNGQAAQMTAQAQAQTGKRKFPPKVIKNLPPIQ